MAKEQTQLNRVFILGGKGLSEDEWREGFKPHGTIEDIWITKDRRSGDDKGVTYITYSKTSEACRAVEEMNGQCLPNMERPLKVILASDKRDGSRRNVDEDQMLRRLFIVVPKGQSERDVKDHFSQYGSIEYVRLINDRKTRHPKGLAYVKFRQQYDAAKALEECDRAYRPIFADMKPKEEDYREYRPRDYSGGRDNYNGYSDYGRRDGRHDVAPPPPPGIASSLASFSALASMIPQVGGPAPMGGGGAPMAGGGTPSDLLRNYSHRNECSLEAMVPEILSQEHVYRLFDLIPGLRNCNLDRRTGVAMLEYSTPQSAAYAKDKVDNMEYPPGCRLAVRYPLPAAQRNSLGNVTAGLNQSIAGVAAGGPALNENIQTLVDSIQKASQILQSAGVAAPGLGAAGLGAPTPSMSAGGGQDHAAYCSVPLPTRKPFADRDAKTAERLFIVSKPDRFDDGILEDALCRFGYLIGASFMPGKTFGYAKFSSSQSAEEAISVLHGQQIYGNQLKVMIADPPKYESRDYEPSEKRKKSP